MPEVSHNEVHLPNIPSFGGGVMPNRIYEKGFEPTPEEQARLAEADAKAVAAMFQTETMYLRQWAIGQAIEAGAKSAYQVTSDAKHLLDFVRQEGDFLPPEERRRIRRERRQAARAKAKAQK